MHSQEITLHVDYFGSIIMIMPPLLATGRDNAGVGNRGAKPPPQIVLKKIT